jgi:CheY-like chemotaxis protein
MRLTADPILKHIPVIFLTAIVRQKEVEEHQGIIGGSVYIAKPVSVDRLISVIEKHIRS